MQDDKYILQSVDNALAILDLFREHDELGATEVAKLMCMGKSTAFRLLTTMEGKGYLAKKGNSKYRLGVKLYTLGRLVYDRSDLMYCVHPYLEKLTKETGETSHLVVWLDSTQVVFIDKVLSSSSIRMDSVVGMTRQAHITGTGKSLLAFQSAEFIDNYVRSCEFPNLTSNTIRNEDALRAQLKEIRINRYSVDDQESEVGLTCYASPIMGYNDQAIAAVSISGPSSRMEENRDVFLDRIREYAALISELLT